MTKLQPHCTHVVTKLKTPKHHHHKRSNEYKPNSKRLIPTQYSSKFLHLFRTWRTKIKTYSESAINYNAMILLPSLKKKEMRQEIKNIKIYKVNREVHIISFLMACHGMWKKIKRRNYIVWCQKSFGWKYFNIKLYVIRNEWRWKERMLKIVWAFNLMGLCVCI